VNIDTHGSQYTLPPSHENIETYMKQTNIHTTTNKHQLKNTEFLKDVKTRKKCSQFGSSKN